MKNTPHRSLALVFTLLAPLGCDESRLKVFVDTSDAGDVGDAPSGGPDGFVPPAGDAAVYPDLPTPADAPLAADTPPVIVCGNGLIQMGETCDDGNPVPGDGCSGVC